jgi:hypothetical protein
MVVRRITLPRGGDESMEALINQYVTNALSGENVRNGLEILI